MCYVQYKKLFHVFPLKIGPSLHLPHRLIRELPSNPSQVQLTGDNARHKQVILDMKPREIINYLCRPLLSMQRCSQFLQQVFSMEKQSGIFHFHNDLGFEITMVRHTSSATLYRPRHTISFFLEHDDSDSDSEAWLDCDMNHSRTTTPRVNPHFGDMKYQDYDTALYQFYKNHPYSQTYTLQQCAQQLHQFFLLEHSLPIVTQALETLWN
jgi:hypothetical protein